MLPWSLWAENIFSVFLEIFFSDRKFFKSKYFKSFFGNYFCSCFMFPWSLWAENIFLIFEVRDYPSIYDFGLEVSPWKCDLRRQASPLQHELGSGSSRYRRYVSRMTRTENFLSQNFSKFFWKPLFSTIHATLITLSQKYFFRISKKWKFWIRNQQELSNLYYENW